MKELHHLAKCRIYLDECHHLQDLVSSPPISRANLKRINNQAEVKAPTVQAHEVGPEYLAIDPSNNFQSGFFYLAREDEKIKFEK